MNFFTILEKLAQSKDRNIRGHAMALQSKRIDLEKILATADAIRESNICKEK